jgi:serine 3-dehydrogenase (NADP+)
MSGQVVLILGASSGIGRATAALFAREGARVVAVARREDRLHSLQDELKAERFNITVRRGDVSNAGEMVRLAEETITTLGRIDALVYASGTNTPDRSMERLNPDIWQRLIDVNLNGAYYATQAVLPAMRSARSGLLIYISSMGGVMPDLSGAAYQASKRGILGLAHAIRMEEKQNGIRSSVICPGLTDTELVEQRPVRVAPEILATALQAEDVAETILYVAKLHPRAVIPELHMVPAVQ